MSAAELLRTAVLPPAFVLALAWAGGASGSASAQSFELATPDGLQRSQATLDGRDLLITDAAGQTTVYRRQRRYDTADGRYAGYVSDAIARVVRWPTAGRGAMQLADLNDPRPRFRRSQMTVRPLAMGNPAVNPVPGQGRVSAEGGVPGFGSFQPRVIDIQVAPVGGPAVAGPATPQRGRLTTEDAMVHRLVLEADANRPAAMGPTAARDRQYWVILPVTRDVVRLQLVSGGTLWSLSATRPAGPVVLAASRQDAAQLWRAVEAGGVLRFDSVAYPGRSLAGAADGVVQLERTSDAAAQHWLASFAPPPPTLPLPIVRLARHELRSLPALPPAKVRLVNSHSNAVTVMIRDLRSGRTEQTLQIPAGQSRHAELQRDPGGAIVERYEYQTPDGFITSEETITPIPPAPWYEIIVYEQYLASIAIDRTGKSPNVIEDINYQRKGVGVFPVPAGQALADGSTIDVWRQAKAMGNAGALPVWKQDHAGSQRLDPLQRTLQELGVPQQ
ncbi:hypothetical protein [Roseimaritima ulvae]|uniref:SLA1 homology domain-containing protein n=1 Tax=Roseimaritima ulvae TaxID=980254 RepID=A0A5B9QZZ0_9BACT|nr:hypothetical protein [Roseimaritima ulvae]QEG43510.1 hypothetical protein UC8_55610 [Roseimaritima ulvae]